MRKIHAAIASLHLTASSMRAFARRAQLVLKHDAFVARIWAYHREHRRAFPWRDVVSPYGVFISEVMLQQTQTHRVVPKYLAFVDAFADFNALANAPFADILALWKGLGYNRRALALKNAAQIIVEDFGGILPDDPALLVSLPGIGKATASSITAFAFNKPTVFIETNIRTVFIDAFFKDRTDVHDRELLPLIEATLAHHASREWYYALMDYGVMLKKTHGNVSRQSVHYHRQSRFVGSDRQVRGKILGVLLTQPRIAQRQLPRLVGADDERCERILRDLHQEGLIKLAAKTVCLAS